MPIKPEDFYVAAQDLNGMKPPLVSDEVCARTMLNRMYHALDAVPNDNPPEEASEMALQAAEAPAIEAKIADAAVVIEELARQIFGPAAYLRRGIHVDMETGDEDVAFEVHYCFPDPEGDFDRLVALNEDFMDAYVRTLTPDILSRIILKPIPTDAV